MDNSQRSLKVFLCHAHADRNQVRTLYTRLIKDNVDAWLDKEKLLPGQDWQREIQNAVHEADVVVVCLSKQFNQGGYRQREVRFAIETALNQPEGEIFIIPARLEECENLESLEKWQWVDLFEYDGYERLMRALRARAAKLGITLRMKKSLFQGALQNRLDELNSEEKPELKTSPLKAESSKNSPSINTGEPNSLKKVKKHSPNASFRVVLIGLVGILIIGLLGSPAIVKWIFPATPTATQTAESSLQSPNPPVTSETSTDEVTVSEPPPSETLSAVGVDNMFMVLIPAGKFPMGSKGNDPDEGPLHDVYLDSYYIDQTEVTNAMYSSCVQSGECEAPSHNTSFTQNASNSSFYYGNPKYDNYPVVYVSWNDAKDYCEFVGRRLPTEAEWEKAASWDDAKDVKRIFPWGNSIDCSYANFYGGENKTLCVGDTTVVGSYVTGASFYGVLDMAGNVSEWVADRYDAKYYADSSETNPKGPPQGDYIVIRGGSFLVGGDNNIRSSDREKLPPDNTSHNVGFRCAMDATP